MKTAKLKGVTTVEAAGLIAHLGGQVMCYRDAPLLSETQIPEVVEEFKAGKCDSIMFDQGAVFDVVAYELATKCTVALKVAFADKLKVVTYNVPDND